MKNLLLVFFIIFILTGCNNRNTKEVKIAEQYGLAYAPVKIMKEKNFLEKRLPGVNVKWTKLANTTAIREAMLSDDLDVGFMAIPPFLIGYDGGMSWKIMTGLSKSPLGLVTNDSSIKSLKDFKVEDKIALPQPGSIQHILLSMACEEQLGRSDYLDNSLIAMKHPDGYQALESKKVIKAHFTSPPYLFQELNNENNNLIISGKEAFGGDFSFIVGVCREEFYKNEIAYEAFISAIEDSINFIRDNQEETLQILSSEYDIEKEILNEYIYDKDMEYTKEIFGVKRFMEFMVKNKYIDKDYEISDLIWE